MKIDLLEPDNPELNVAPLIDMVFLLLVYFMVTASLVQSEADLSIKLPGMLAQAEAVDMADEQVIEIFADSRVVLNGRTMDRPDRQELPELTGLLIRYRLASEASKNEALITIWAEDETRHQRVVDVMNACADAGIKNVTFSNLGDE